MRIYDRNLTGTAGAETGHTRETQRPGNSSGGMQSVAGGRDGDRVEFSQTLGRLSQALEHDRSSHAAKLQALAAQYQSGSYQPDSASISRAMVSDALGAEAPE